MTKEHLTNEEKKGKVKPDKQAENREQATDASVDRSGLAQLQNQVGNRAVQRMLAQRSGDGPTTLDEETAGRINRERGGGHPLDSAMKEQMGTVMGQDFSNVRVHTSRESDDLNQQVGAKAFTTGQDIFFKEGAYDPGSSGGQELIAHELTHVVQQSSGAVGNGSGRMTVNAPGDVYEQEADAVAKQVTSMDLSVTAGGDSVQRQAAPKNEEELQTKAVQRQEGVEEEEEMQTNSPQQQDVPEEEDLQTKSVQREELPEDEEMAG
ncbi:MAG: DUF4157 domain-containing protein [Anaerolineae bacterium]|nr:DUF4157 domain-containing protein [Anaerolineae bacterium]MCB9102404.1 DUF4157 domain-containing protein [Anaerolineales bacterium]MCB9107680.1 DUF4157 domain-containing protein [Anaerolineales bacterium]